MRKVFNKKMNMAFVDNNDFIEQHQHNLPNLHI